MRTFDIIMYLAAAVCFALAFFAPRRPALASSQLTLVALGLLAWVLVPLVTTIRS